MIFVAILLLIAGFVALVKGADVFVDGAAALAGKFGIPQLVIGLTIVAMGTSLPEAAVSITAGIKGNAGITVGNIVGSNILNILIILGVTALITNVAIQKTTFKCEIPYMLLITAVLLVMGMTGNEITFIEGVILWILFIAYLLYLYILAKKGNDSGDEQSVKLYPVWKCLLFIVLGGVCVVIGSQFVVNGATTIARACGMSERFIGLTIVAFGTSLPELVIGYPEPSLSIDLWKKYWDEIQLRISAPNNDMLEIPDTITNQAKGFTYRYNLDGTDIYITGGGPSPYSPFQEIFIELMGSEYISPGIWKISLKPISVKDGSWDIWLPSGALRNAQTSFIHASPDITLTIPSTAQNVISVGAYDSRTNRTAAFSGRGYTWAFDSIKPDIIAPGVDIISCSNTGGYTSKTGTSMATPFVTGAAALLMEWGIVRGNDLYMYGDKLKASLIKGAGENVFTTASRAVSENTSKNTKYPNPVTGWGTLCLLDSIP